MEEVGQGVKSCFGEVPVTFAGSTLEGHSGVELTGLIHWEEGQRLSKYPLQIDGLSACCNVLFLFFLFEGPTIQLPNKSHMEVYS